MRPLFPKAGAPVLNPALGDIFHPEWYRSLRTLWESLGWSVDRKVYNDLGPNIFVWVGANFCSFRDGQTDSITASFHLPNSYCEGADVYPYATVIGSSGSEAATSFTLTPAVYLPGAASTSPTAQTITPTVDNVTSVFEFSALDGSEFLRNTIISFTLQRAAVDAYAGDVTLLSVGLKIPIQGSGQEVRFAS
jgi:hypothetical protein